MLDHLSTRARIFSLVIVSALPLLLLSVYGALVQRTSGEVTARNEIRHHVQFITTAITGTDVGRLALLDDVILGRGETMEIVDESALVLARYPADSPAVGEERADPSLIAVAAGTHDLIFEHKDYGGVPRLFAFKRASMYADGSFPVLVFVSVPIKVMHEESNRTLVQSLIGVAIVTLVLVFTAWFGAESLVLRRIRALLGMAAKVQAGDLRARTGMARGAEELSQLGSALDEMAGQLESRDTKLRELLEELRSQAITDALTGLYNRRYLWDVLRRELIAARRKETRLSIILIDLDHFKRVNDIWGHDAGDRVLQETAGLLRSHVRGSDIAVRYGGEEFALVLPETSARVAEERAESLRRELEARAIEYEGQTIRITLCCGIAESDAGSVDEVALMKRADEALYAAKRTGRNKVIVHGGVDMCGRKPELRAHA